MVVLARENNKGGSNAPGTGELTTRAMRSLFTTHFFSDICPPMGKQEIPP